MIPVIAPMISCTGLGSRATPKVPCACYSPVPLSYGFHVRKEVAKAHIPILSLYKSFSKAFNVEWHVQCLPPRQAWVQDCEQ